MRINRTFSKYGIHAHFLFARLENIIHLVHATSVFVVPQIENPLKVLQHLPIYALFCRQQHVDQRVSALGPLEIARFYIRKHCPLKLLTTIRLNRTTIQRRICPLCCCYFRYQIQVSIKFTNLPMSILYVYHLILNCKLARFATACTTKAFKFHTSFKLF